MINELLQRSKKKKKKKERKNKGHLHSLNGKKIFKVCQNQVLTKYFKKTELSSITLRMSNGILILESNLVA